MVQWYIALPTGMEHYLIHEVLWAPGEEDLLLGCPICHGGRRYPSYDPLYQELRNARRSQEQPQAGTAVLYLEMVSHGLVNKG